MISFQQLADYQTAFGRYKHFIFPTCFLTDLTEEEKSLVFSEMLDDGFYSRLWYPASEYFKQLTDEQRQKQIMLAVDSGDLELALKLKKAK